MLYFIFKPYKRSNTEAERDYIFYLFYFISTGTGPVYNLHTRVGRLMHLSKRRRIGSFRKETPTSNTRILYFIDILTL